MMVPTFAEQKWRVKKSAHIALPLLHPLYMCLLCVGLSARRGSALLLYKERPVAQLPEHTYKEKVIHAQTESKVSQKHTHTFYYSSRQMAIAG